MIEGERDFNKAGKEHADEHAKLLSEQLAAITSKHPHELAEHEVAFLRARKSYLSDEHLKKFNAHLSEAVDEEPGDSQEPKTPKTPKK